MADFNLTHELQKLYQYLYGAQHVTDDDNAQFVLHKACHKLNDIINIHEKHLIQVENMIDNYCEHEWRLYGINAIYCHICDEHVEYDQ